MALLRLLLCFYLLNVNLLTFHRLAFLCKNKELFT